MKLNTEQKALVLKLMGLGLNESPSASVVGEDLFAKIETGEVHIMPEGTMDRIVENIKHLQGLHAKKEDLVQTYITTVQKRCNHVFSKPPKSGHWRREPADSCWICGKVKQKEPLS